MTALAGTAYCTLLISDNYLPGAAVLAHSLRDNGTKGKLVAFYTPDTLQDSTIQELKIIYDEIIPVERITNGTPANLFLMDRLDLISTFTKIELWRQTQFRRLVYIDSDVVAIRAPDELLSLDVDFAAAPDVGWPDCFNSGVMVLRPNIQDYNSLVALAERGVSFDGADQGLFNIHFKNWHRLSFTYNCTPSSSYQYVPAYRHFESTISMIHFIGSQKPWNMPRHSLGGGTPYDQLLGRWWAVYDRHYRPLPTPHHPTETYKPDTTIRYDPASGTFSRPSQTPPTVVSSSQPYDRPYSPDAPFSEIVHIPHQNPVTTTVVDPSAIPIPAPELHHPSPRHPAPAPVFHDDQIAHITEEGAPAIRSAVPQYVYGEEHRPEPSYEPTHQSQSSKTEHEPAFKGPTQEHVHQQQDQQQHQHEQIQYHHSPHQPEIMEQAQKDAPPPPPQEQRPFSPPKVEWDASREPPPLHSKPEASSLHTQTYSMSEDTKLFQPPPTYPEAPKNMYYDVPKEKPEPKRLAKIFPWESQSRKPTRVFADETVAPTESPVATTSTSQPTTARSSITSVSAPPVAKDLWGTYSLSNAWDEVPEINRYIESIQKPRKGSIQVVSGNTTGGGQGSETGSSRRPSIKITDFPTEIERPSLPVTPAPVRRSSFWGEATEASRELPSAEGVPNQEDWNPLARLEELQRRQLELFEAAKSQQKP